MTYRHGEQEHDRDDGEKPYPMPSVLAAVTSMPVHQHPQGDGVQNAEAPE